MNVQMVLIPINAIRMQPAQITMAHTHACVILDLLGMDSPAQVSSLSEIIILDVSFFDSLAAFQLTKTE